MYKSKGTTKIKNIILEYLVVPSIISNKFFFLVGSSWLLLPFPVVFPSFRHEPSFPQQPYSQKQYSICNIQTISEIHP